MEEDSTLRYVSFARFGNRHWDLYLCVRCGGGTERCANVASACVAVCSGSRSPSVIGGYGRGGIESPLLQSLFTHQKRKCISRSVSFELFCYCRREFSDARGDGGFHPCATMTINFSGGEGESEETTLFYALTSDYKFKHNHQQTEKRNP